MIPRFVVLFFLMLGLAGSCGLFGNESGETLKPVLEAFNQSIEREAKKKIEEAQERQREGKFQKAQDLIRQAMLLETLKVEEGRTSEEKLLELKDQMSSSEKKDWMKRFLHEGDRLAELGMYDLAVDEYEKVFLLEPEHRAASERIDRIKKQFLKEERRSLEKEGKTVEEELKKRVEIFLNQARELMQAENIEGARRTLERVLVLDPKNKKARKLLKQVNEKLKQ